jgi:hypothetical protein
MTVEPEPREPVERTDVWRSANDLSYAKSLDICSNAERSTDDHDWTDQVWLHSQRIVSVDPRSAELLRTTLAHYTAAALERDRLLGQLHDAKETLRRALRNPQTTEGASDAEL